MSVGTVGVAELVVRQLEGLSVMEVGDALPKTHHHLSGVVDEPTAFLVGREIIVRTGNLFCFLSGYFPQNFWNFFHYLCKRLSKESEQSYTNASTCTYQ